MESKVWCTCSPLHQNAGFFANRDCLRFTSFDGIAGNLLREGALSYDAHAKLLTTSAHAFRHTFGTRAVARDMPIDVVQRILGHASLQTTSIYVHAERQRMLDAAAQYYSEEGG
jgi:integrase